MCAAKRVASAIPVGTQFSPALFDLRAFAEALVAASGDKAAIEKAIWKPGIRTQMPKRRPSRRLSSLPVEAAVQYGLLEKGTYRATALAESLSQLHAPALYDAFARHILLNCRGLRVLDGIQQMEADGLTITGDTLAAHLTSQGLPVTVHNTAINTLRMWLAKAGLFSEHSRGNAWKYDEDVKERLLGLNDDSLGILAGLTIEERAFVLALCRLSPTTWCKAADVRDLAEATSNVRLSRGNAKDYLEPLQLAGIIEFRSGGTRAGKSAVVRTTRLFNKEVLEAFVARTILDLDGDVSAYFKRRPEDIYIDLHSKNTFKKGQALEAYAIMLMRLLGMRFLGWRKRARDTTGSAEVDAVFTGVVGAVPTRWQVQCKNTPSGQVDLEDVAKEVGLIPITQATHVLIVANSRITKDAREFAKEVMYRSALTIFLLDRTDFEEVRANAGRLGSILRRDAEQVVRQNPAGSLFGAGKARALGGNPT